MLERLSRSEWPTPIIALAGNHEDLLLRFLEDERILEAWRGLGGLETLHSYGVDVGPGLAGRDFKKIQAAFKARFPEHHRQFLETLQTSTAIGDYFFCHAGIRPGVPLDRQNRDDLLNIRDEFLLAEAEHGKLIVHGHTPSVTPEIRSNRIGIDTAAYATNRLTCLVLEKDERRFLYAGGSGAGKMTMNVGFKAPVTLGSEPAERGLDLRTYLNFLWRNWMFIGAIVALSLLVAIVYLARATPMYTATAQILLDPQQEKGTAGGGDLVPSQIYNYATMESQLSIINSDPLLRRVVIKEQLAASPQTDTPQSEDEKSAQAQRIQDAINRVRGALAAKRRRAIQRIRYFNHLARSQASRAARQCGG